MKPLLVAQARKSAALFKAWCDKMVVATDGNKPSLVAHNSRVHTLTLTAFPQPPLMLDGQLRQPRYLLALGSVYH